MSKKSILIADDDRDLVEALSARCRKIGLEVYTAHNALTVVTLLETTRPDVICLDVQMPTGNGLNICETLADDPRTANTPVIILTGRQDEHTIKRCHAMCVYYVLKCADVWTRIEPLLYELLDIEPGRPEPDPPAAAGEQKAGEQIVEEPSAEGAEADATDESAETHDEIIDTVFSILGIDWSFIGDGASEEGKQTDGEASPPWVLHIEDDADLSESVKTRLEAYGVAVVRAFSGMEGYRRAFTHPADAIILDVEMPNGQGDYVLRRLKETPATKDIPVIILTGVKDTAMERKMLNLGAQRYFTKPPVMEDLVDELRRHINILAEPVAV